MFFACFLRFCPLILEVLTGYRKFKFMKICFDAEAYNQTDYINIKRKEMIQAEKGSVLEPVRVGPNSLFQFECHKKIGCFNQCCHGININLTPYDIIRLKNKLQLSSEDFLTLYTELQVLEKTGLPVVHLKLLNNEASSCPFLTEEGCYVYEDRPLACRYYPLGVATLSHRESEDNEFYFFIHEPHCLGFKEEKQWTVRQWRQNQEADFYDKINASWVDLILRKRSFPPNMMLTEQSKQMFFLASYNIDKFRRFIFDTSFLNRYEIDEDKIVKMKTDELVLLEFGMSWLKWILYRKGDFATKEYNKTQ